MANNSSACGEIYVGDCHDLLAGLADDFADLVFTSPPYEDARDYGIGFKHSGADWVNWAWPRFEECLRVSKGLVAWVVEGKTTKFRWSATPMRLALKIADAGYILRKPPIFHRHGIPGSGGTDWLRNDYEFIICASKGPIPWTDQTALGPTPKNRIVRYATNRGRDGKRKSNEYHDPDRANPGNVISLAVGSGNMGWPGAHLNEAPFPERLAEFFVRTFCPSGGIVLDPFCGSGTTIAVAQGLGRLGWGFDIRPDQVELSQKRCRGMSPEDIRIGQEFFGFV